MEGIGRERWRERKEKRDEDFFPGCDNLLQRGNGQIIGQSYVLIHSPEESLLFQENFLSYSSFLHILFQNREIER